MMSDTTKNDNRTSFISTVSDLVTRLIRDTVSDDFKQRVEATRETCGFRKSNRLKESEQNLASTLEKLSQLEIQ